MGRIITFSNLAKKDIFDYFKNNEFNYFKTLVLLLSEIDKTNDQTNMCGPREMLSKNLSGWISRRISWRHRLVYIIDDKEIFVLTCREHYPIPNNKQ